MGSSTLSVFDNGGHHNVNSICKNKKFKNIKKCGEFCVAFVNIVNCVTSYTNFINSFSENTYINDIIVDKLMK